MRSQVRSVDSVRTGERVIKRCAGIMTNDEWEWEWELEWHPVGMHAPNKVGIERRNSIR